jgi:hypothetical protein
MAAAEASAAAKAGAAATVAASRRDPYAPAKWRVVLMIEHMEGREANVGKDFPASTLVTVSGLSTPAMLIEVSTVAVIGSK